MRRNITNGQQTGCEDGPRRNVSRHQALRPGFIRSRQAARSEQVRGQSMSTPAGMRDVRARSEKSGARINGRMVFRTRIASFSGVKGKRSRIAKSMIKMVVCLRLDQRQMLVHALS